MTVVLLGRVVTRLMTTGGGQGADPFQRPAWAWPVSVNQNPVRPHPGPCRIPPRLGPKLTAQFRLKREDGCGCQTEGKKAAALPASQN